MTNNFVFEADIAAKKIQMSREFNAPIEKVWKAYTDPELAKKWMAPKPWRIEPQVWDYTAGGIVQYLMLGTEGEKHWVYDEITELEKERYFKTTGMFCDEDGKPKRDGSKSYQDIRFSAIDGNKTRVDTIIEFDDEATIKWFVEGGFKEGTAVTLNQLDEVLVAE